MKLLSKVWDKVVGKLMDWLLGTKAGKKRAQAEGRKAIYQSLHPMEWDRISQILGK